jgi:hypothetical protein
MKTITLTLATLLLLATSSAHASRSTIFGVPGAGAESLIYQLFTGNNTAGQQYLANDPTTYALLNGLLSDNTSSASIASFTQTDGGMDQQYFIIQINSSDASGKSVVTKIQFDLPKAAPNPSDGPGPSLGQIIGYSILNSSSAQ